jgi:transposase
MEVRNTFAHALPATTSLPLNTWYLEDARAPIPRRISSTQVAPRCPGCDAPARSVHSRYIRTLADLPWGSYGSTWRLRVRKLFCRDPACARRTFTERLPGLGAPWARRLAARLLALGLAPGGAAGGRLSRHVGLTVSRTTLLRMIRRTPRPGISAPQVLSVDEFALRKRHTSGTILLDLERGRPLALLPDREAGTVAQWLQAHPGVEVVVRGRAEADAEAAALAQDFAALVRRRQPPQLDPWLTRAATRALAPFRRLAKGLRADDAAVKAGVTRPWSPGPIEGHSNRLKMLKRRMFGRACVDLLAQRFLLAA